MCDFLMATMILHTQGSQYFWGTHLGTLKGTKGDPFSEKGTQRGPKTG